MAKLSAASINTFSVGGGNKPRTLTVKDSEQGRRNAGARCHVLRFAPTERWQSATPTPARFRAWSCRPAAHWSALAAKIGELVLSNAAAGSTSTGYGLKLWNGNTNACTIGKITDNTKSKSLTVQDLLETDHAKCELYGEKDSVHGASLIRALKSVD